MKTILLIIPIIFLTGCSIVPQRPSQPRSVNTVVPVGNEQPIVSKNSLDLSDQQLKKVPESVFKQTDLVALDLSNNELTGSVPGEIRFLQKLTILDLSDNSLTGVSAEIGQLKDLETLDLSNNQLTGLPYELSNLSNLKILNLSGNQYSEQDLKIILEKLPADVTIIK